MSNKQYFISTGYKTGFYTLRVAYYDHNVLSTGEVVHTYHESYLGNLATDWERAIAKARRRVRDEYHSQLLSEKPFELTPFGRNEAAWQVALVQVDPYTLPFGRYSGQDMREVIKDDPDYLCWMLSTLYSKPIEGSRTYPLVPKRVALALLLGDYPAELEVRKAREKAAREAEHEAAKKPVPTGHRVTVRGRIVKKNSAESAWGWVTKITVACDGFTVYGTKPANLSASVGDEIEFCANVKASDRDNSFGFFSRPTKAKLVQI